MAMPLKKVREADRAATVLAIAAHPMAPFFALNVRRIASFFAGEHFSFWAICGYLFIEYVRPQSIIHAIDILPWGKLFIFLSAVSWAADKNRRWNANPINKWMVVYLLVVILATFTASWPEVSEAHFMDFFGWFMVYFLIVNIVNSERRLFVFLLIFLLASFKLSLFGAKTWALRGFAFTDWGLMGPEGFFQNSGEFAVQMLVMLPISYHLTMLMRPWLSRVKFAFMLAMPITAAMSVLGASSRGAQIGLAFQSYLTFLRRRLSLRTILLVAVLGVLVYFVLPTEQIDRFRSIGDDKPSQQRLLYWKGGVKMIEEHPILGVGYFNFAPYFELHHPREVLYGKAQLPHNIFIQVGTDAGVVGLLAYMFLILSGFAATRAVRRDLKQEQGHWLYVLSYGFDASFVGFLIAGQFVTIGYYPFMWIHLALVAATRNVVRSQKALEPKRSRQRRLAVPTRGRRMA
jgi:putative inorganic carbon (HCO3(-)) transporter